MAGDDVAPATGLIADIGGTNARFALACGPGGAVRDIQVFACDDYPGPAEAAAAYLAGRDLPAPPRAAAFAIAAPVLGDEVGMTNHPWSFSIEALRRRMGLERLTVLNDLAAVAHGVRSLAPSDLLPLGGGPPRPGAPVGIVAPGTGLGISSLVPGSQGCPDIVLPGEGGHATMPAADEREAAVLAILRRRYGHVSAERVLSGPGLVNLYEALAEFHGEPEIPPLTPELITRRAAGRDCPVCTEAVTMFCAMLGSVAGNLALTLGAHGGIFIAGGIVPALGERFLASPFRRAFEAKGRFAGYLAAIPAWVIRHPFPALVGLSRLL